jgi:hypothetical protein
VRSTAIEIRPTRGIANLGLRELWRFRDLAYFFMWRDVKVQYKQTFFGFAWAIVQPLLLMVVFTFVFGTVLNVAGGAAVSLNGARNVIEQLTGAPLMIKPAQIQPGDVRRTSGAIDMAAELLDWKPADPLEEGLARQIAWQTSQAG